MLGITDLKTGVTFLYRNEPQQVLEHQHVKMGRGGAVLRVKMRNLKTGAVIEETFRGNETFPEANVEKHKVQFLYESGDKLTLMDQTTYEQFEPAKELAGEQAKYLAEGAECDVLVFQDQPIGISLPIKVVLTIKETPPGFKGDTAARSYKPATLETGATAMVPFHIKTGDQVVIDTRTGEYVERA